MRLYIRPHLQPMPCLVFLWHQPEDLSRGLIPGGSFVVAADGKQMTRRHGYATKAGARDRFRRSKKLAWRGRDSRSHNDAGNVIE